MFDPTAATTTGAGASRPSSRRAWLPLLQPLMLLACFLLTLVVFSCPDPLSASSGITLLTVRPYNMTETTVSNGATNANSSASSAGSTIVFGGANATTSTATTSPVNATGAASATTNASTSTPSVSATSTADPATATSNRTLAASPAVAANESAAPAPASTASTANEPGKRSPPLLLPGTNFQPLNISSSSSRSPPQQLERVTDDPLDTHGSLNNGTSSSSSSTTNSSSTPSVSITTSTPTGESLSLLELKYGPLGSCFRTWSGSRACTPASLKPSYDASHLTLKALGGFDTSGLPTTLKTTPALLVACISLLAALALSSGLAAGARLFPGTKLAAPLLQAGPAQRAWGTMQRAALWLRLGVALLLLGTAVSMRLVVSKAAYAFNASNAAKSIGAAYLTPSAATAAAGQHATGGATQIGLQAVAGKGFGLLWATVLMLLIDFCLERRRLRREEAVAVARADLEAAWGREAVAMANLGKSASAGETKRSKIKVVQQQEESEEEETGDEEEQVKPADASRRRSFFWPTSPRLSRPRKVARKAVPSYKGGLAPVLGPLFNPAPAPAPAPAPVQSQVPYAGHAGAAGQGAVYIVQDKAGRQAAPQPQRVITRNDYHYHHHHQQAAPSRKGSMSSASMSSCSGAAAPRAYYQYGSVPRPQQQQQQQQQVPVATLPFESTAGGLASPPWASSTQMQQQQQQQYSHSLGAVAATTTQGATLPAYRSRDPLVGTRAPAAAPFGQYATYDDDDDDAEEQQLQQQLAQPWRLKSGQHLLHRRASIDSPRSLAFNTTRGGRGVVAAASDDGHLQARLPAQSQHQRSHSLNHHDPAPFASWKTKEAFELQAAPVHRAGARPPAPAPHAGSMSGSSRSNSPYPPRVMRARRMSTSGESVGSMRSASGMGIGLRYVRS